MSNLGYAYDNLDAKMNENPVYGSDLTRELAKMSQEDNKTFTYLIAIADNMREKSGLRKLDIRDTVELAKVYNSGFPVISPPNPSNFEKWYIYQSNHTEIAARFDEDKTYFAVHGSNMYIALQDNDRALAAAADRGKFDLSNGEYEPAPIVDKKIEKSGNVLDNLCKKVGGWFGRTQSENEKNITKNCFEEER